MAAPQKVYLAFAENDRLLLDQFKQHLSGLERAGLISLWDITNIEAGDDSDLVRKEALLSADWILLLVSADFLASAFAFENEVKIALDQQRLGKAIVVPVLLRDCLWQYESYANLAALPKNHQPVMSQHWESPDDAFTQVVAHLAQQIKAKATVADSSEILFDQGEYIDPRDQRRYPVIELNGNWWLGKNLRFPLEEGCSCYDDDPTACEQNGALYTWEAALKASPPGWHLASATDWQSLIDFYGTEHLAYKHLGPGGDSGLEMAYGGKYSLHSQQFVLGGQFGFYWSSEELNYEQAFYFMFDTGMGTLRKIPVAKNIRASCRYVWSGNK